VYADHECMGRPLGREAYGLAKSGAVRRQQRGDIVICFVKYGGCSLYRRREAVRASVWPSSVDFARIKSCWSEFLRQRPQRNESKASSVVCS
jgi:hypothetical protein